MKDNSTSLKKYIENIKHGGFQSLLRKAVSSGIQVDLIQQGSLHILKLEYEKEIVFCSKRKIPIYQRMGNLTKNKETTKTILRASGIHTPRGITATSLKEALTFIKNNQLHYPLICKPVDGSLAKGVTWDITSQEELRTAISHAKNAYGKRLGVRFLVEEMFVSNEYRVLVLDGEVISCVQKIPAGIIGDGISTIKKLLHDFNIKRAQGFEIKIDTIAKDSMSSHNLTMSSVLPKNHFFKLRNNLNMSDGGRCIECTDVMHPHFKDICSRAIKAVGLTYGGIDFFAHDISSPKSKYIVLEINSNPYYNMHEKPLVEGHGIDVSQRILESLFPKFKYKKERKGI